MSAAAELPMVEEASAKTLGLLYLQAEGSRSRRAILRWRDGGRWIDMPAWRFHRQVIRVGLFLRERLGVGPGDRVLVASRLRSERIVAEWAIVTLGAAAITVDADSSHAARAFLSGGVAAKAAFADGPRESARLVELPQALAPEKVVTLDPGPRADGVRSWVEILDLGGTLDTAERAQSFRQQARTLPSHAAALGYFERANGGGLTLVTHAELVNRLRAFWARVPPHDGDRAYVAAGDRGPTTGLPLWAFVADGRTSTILGTPSHEDEEMAEVDPHTLVGSPELARRVGRASASRWTPLLRRLLPGNQGPKERHSLRDIVMFDGTKIESEQRRTP